MTFQIAAEPRYAESQVAVRPGAHDLAVVRSLPLQSKLLIGSRSDHLEREADSIAAEVTTEHIASPNVAHRLSSASGAGAADAVGGSVGTALSGPGAALDSQTRGEFESRFGRTFADIRVHSDTKAAESARALGALAYTSGRHIAFAAGRYAPRTRAGAELLAHELAHTIQQRDGGTTIQCRRVPEGTALSSVLPIAGSTDQAAHERGLLRVLRRAFDSLGAAEKTTVKTAAAAFGVTGADDAALFTSLAAGSRSKLLQFAQAIRTVEPGFTLGDPALIDVGARPGTSDAANIATLVSNADAVFNTIAGGSRDADISKVFGAGNVAAAKAKYAAARTRMNALKSANKIVTDRSGFSAEVFLGGLSNSAQISVSPSTIDNPNDNESKVTLIHESMHAGNPGDVKDKGYIDQPSFKKLAESIKLTNAAHFEVVPRRILGTPFAFAGETFIPAGATVGGVHAAALTPKEEAIRNASELFRGGWTAGLNLHKLYLRVFKAPTEWNTLDLGPNFSGAESGAHFADTLPFWSKVENLTIHNRTGITPSSANLAFRPVSVIDMALSEGLTRKLAIGMVKVPADEPAATALEASADASQLAKIATGVGGETDVLMELVRDKETKEITGSRNRDIRAIKRLATAASASAFSDYLKKRPPADFVD